MPNNKKHHYVPRFYLKRFSPNGRSICLWNIKNETIVISANLKNQCYKNYFYGKESHVEEALSLIEGQTAKIFRLIDMFQAPPRYDSEEYRTLILYLLIQYGRTAYLADLINEMNDRMMKYLLGPQAKMEGIDLNEVTINIKDSAQYALGIMTQFYPLLFDMDCKLLLNETNEEFVTSDNPVVFYNQLFSFKTHGSNTGIASKGLQIFLPISSNMTLLFFDRKSYNVGFEHKAFVKVSSLRDVYELNTLQMASAYENVYFENANFDIKALYRKASPFRRFHKSKMSVFLGEEDENIRRELIATSREDVRTNLKLSFVKLTKETKLWRKNFRKLEFKPTTVYRDKKLVADHAEFLKKVDNGELNPSDFYLYLVQKYGESDD